MALLPKMLSRHGPSIILQNIFAKLCQEVDNWNHLIMFLLFVIISHNINRQVFNYN